MTTDLREYDTQDEVGEPAPRVEFTDPQGSGLGLLYLLGMSLIVAVLIVVAMLQGWPR